MDSTDPDWSERVNIAIESFASTWGGGGFIMVPTDGKEIDSAFWEILLSYDPDYLWSTAKTTSNHEPLLEISEALQDELILRLAPFHYSSDMGEKFTPGQKQNLRVRKATHPNFKAHYPFTDVASIVSNCDHPTEILDISEVDGLTRVWAASCLGLVSESLASGLNSAGINVTSLSWSDNEDLILEAAVRGPQGLPSTGPSVFPMGLSMMQLGFYTPNDFQHWNESTLIIVGDHLADCCLYFSLSRMRAKVAWILRSWLPEHLDPIPGHYYDSSRLARVARKVHDLEMSQQNGGSALLSASLNADELATLRTQFREWSQLKIQDGIPGPPDAEETDSCSLSDSVRYLLRYPRRIFELGNADRITSRHFLKNRLAGFFDVPRPKTFTRVDPDNHHWVTDFSIVGKHFPRHPELGREIVREPLFFSWHARTGRDSVAFVDPRTGYITEDFDTWIRRPEIYLPSAFEIFEKLLSKLGFTARKSDKGRFGARTISKFGTLASFAHFILPHAKRRIFSTYLLDASHDDVATGVFLTFDQRRYLDFGAFENVFGAAVSAATAIYYLMSIAVIYRGLIFKCEECLAAIWYDVSEISSNYICKRCGTAQPYHQTIGLRSFEPTWYYKLDEVVYQTFVHNSDVPLLATFRLSQGTRSFDYSPELAIIDANSNKGLQEIDICCIPDGKLTIGEAKVGDRLGGSAAAENGVLQKYFDLANRIGANQIVFATAAQDWREATKKKIRSKFKGSRTRVLIWKGADLNSTHKVN